MATHDPDAEPATASAARTSWSLLQRARGGEPDAWTRLCELYRPLVIHWCRRWDVRSTDFDDVVQEVFQAAATGLATFRRERSGDTFRGWLCGITRHKIWAYRERQGRQPVAVGGSTMLRQLHEAPCPDNLSPPSARGDDPADADAVAALFRRAVALVQNEFEQSTWSAFWRTTVDAVPTRDVAEELGLSPAAVRMAKSRVLRRLRQEVGDLFED